MFFSAFLGRMEMLLQHRYGFTEACGEATHTVANPIPYHRAYS